MGSRFLKLDSWAYEAIAGLHARGFLPALSALAQPYRRLDVAVGVRVIDTLALREPSATWVRRLRAELAPELERLDDAARTGRSRERLGVEVAAGARVGDSRRLEPLIPWRGDATKAWVYTNNGVGGWLETSNVVADVRVHDDRWYRERGGDPDGRGPGGFYGAGRTDYAYLTLAYDWGSVLIGRVARNWAPLGTEGLMVGENPTPYPQLGLDLGRGRVSFRFLAGELDPIEQRNRYLVANRIDYTSPRLQLSVGEAALYAGHGSTLRLINPVEFLFFDADANQERRDITGNIVLNGTFWALLGRTSIYGELMLDDFDLRPRLHEVDRPVEATSYGIHLGARHPGPADWVELGADYRRVAGWTYRTVAPSEKWTYLDRGLGDAFGDYDRLSLRADLFPDRPGLRLTPVVQLQRKGEGDPRVPMPGNGAVRGLRGMFQGVLERTTRAALQGRWQPVRAAFVDWDVGASRIRNAGHVRGKSETRFSYLARLGLTFAWSRAQ